MQKPVKSTMTGVGTKSHKKVASKEKVNGGNYRTSFDDCPMSYVDMAQVSDSMQSLYKVTT
jgi:hypothetical protein